MRKLVVFLAVGACSLMCQAQNAAWPIGAGSVSFESAGGHWQKAVITDQPTGETSEAYSLEADTSYSDVDVTRRPSIVFSCEQSGGFSGVRIRTGAAVASEPRSISGKPSRKTDVVTWTDHQNSRAWTVEIAANGSDLLFDKVIMSELLMHKTFAIRYVSARGVSITDEYVIEGLSVDSLKADCAELFK